jgi:hypothetical protein
MSPSGLNAVSRRVVIAKSVIAVPFRGIRRLTS